MKKLTGIIFAVFMCFFLGAEPSERYVTINYKGMESGVEEFPEWIDYADEGAVNKVAKAHKINQKQYTVFVQTTQSKNLEYAKNEAIRNIYENLANQQISEENGLEFVNDFWYQVKDTKTKKTVYYYYTVYKLRK